MEDRRQEGRKHVLAINGSPEFLNIVRELFQEEAYNVTTTNYVPTSFDQIAALQPDVLLVDVAVGRHAGGAADDRGGGAGPGGHHRHHGARGHKWGRAQRSGLRHVILSIRSGRTPISSVAEENSVVKKPEPVPGTAVTSATTFPGRSARARPGPRPQGRLHGRS
jgi:hypothetical protein